MSMTEERINEIEQELGKITQGSWLLSYAEPEEGYKDHQITGERDENVLIVPHDCTTWNNMCFIASAPTTVTELISEVKRLRGALGMLAKDQICDAYGEVDGCINRKVGHCWVCIISQALDPREASNDKD